MRSDAVADSRRDDIAAPDGLRNRIDRPCNL